MTLIKIQKLLEEQTDVQYLMYFIFVDKKTSLCTINLWCINRQWTKRKTKIDEALYSKIVGVLKEFRAYERYMKPRLLAPDETGNSWGKRR